MYIHILPTSFKIFDVFIARGKKKRRVGLEHKHM